jgi:hypothetical protein
MRGHSTRPAAIEAEIAHLRSLALDALRRHWRVTFGRTPPSELSKDLLGANDCLSPREEAAPLRRNKTYALSFAQFERELIGERVRDKISASKRKGL